MEIKHIPGTGHAYSCDKEGNIYSHYLAGSHKISDSCLKKLLPYSGINNDYLMVRLSLDGQAKNCLVHRLVALTWIENPNNYEEVDHIDRNVLNNKAENLRWCSRQMNIGHQNVDKGCLNGLRSFCRLYRESDNELIGEFPSITSAAKYSAENYGTSKTGMIRSHRSKEYYIVAENEEKRTKMSQKRRIRWELFSPTGELLGTFNSKREAGRHIKENYRDISVKRFSDIGKAYGYYVIEKSVETN